MGVAFSVLYRYNKSCSHGLFYHGHRVTGGSSVWSHGQGSFCQGTDCDPTYSSEYGAYWQQVTLDCDPTYSSEYGAYWQQVTLDCDPTYSSKYGAYWQQVTL